MAVLDKRWKRVTFVVWWLPLCLITVFFVGFTLVCLDHMYHNEDYALLRSCHERYAKSEFRVKNSSNDEDITIYPVINQRLRDRYSSDVREIEGSPKFMNCMSDTYQGVYWVNYTWASHNAIIYLMWTAFFATFVFTSFWDNAARKIQRSLGRFVSVLGDGFMKFWNWINVREGGV
jgi:hypothetical protein